MFSGAAGGQHSAGGVEIVRGQADLFEVVVALRSPRSFARRLHGRQQERNQDGDDGDNDEELDEREGRPVRLASLRILRTACCERDRAARWDMYFEFHSNSANHVDRARGQSDLQKKTLK